MAVRGAAPDLTAVIASLHVYPVKSLGGFSPATWDVDGFGLRLDRRWMIVDADGVFQTQRVQPRMALGRASPSGDGIRLEGPGMDSLDVPRGRPGERPVAVRVWNHRCAALPCGAKADAWVSDLLGARSRLVYMSDETRRPVEANAAAATGRVSFADAYPMLLISEASLVGLNARLVVPVPMNRFRPNIVVGGVDAHAEDGWTSVGAGELELVVAKSCARCVVTTVDQATGVAGTEPLRTLATYRRGESGVLFGQNVVHRGTGSLGVGLPLTPQQAQA